MSETDDNLRRRRAAVGLCCVLLCVLGVWLRSLGGEFVFDDNLLIKRNPALTELGNWPQILGRGMWSFLDTQEAAHQGYWRPLAGIVMLFTNVWGQGSPLAFHWVTIVLHLAATTAAFALALELADSLGIALLTALLFGVHPVHVESIAWMSALNDPLFALFSFLALRSWIRWSKAGAAGAPWASGILLLLALLSKELGLAVVPLALLHGFVRTRSLGPLRVWLPFALAGALWYAARVAVFASPWAGLERITTDFGVGPARLAQLRIELLGGYTWLALWPVDLKLFHPFRPTLPGTDPEYLRALACSAGIVFAIVWAWRKQAFTLAYALCFLPLSILPALVSVKSLGISPLAERYLYFGVFGFVLALVWCLWRFLPQALAIGICLVVAALYSWKSVARTHFWHDELTLFRTVGAQTPELPDAYWGLGRVLLERYRKSGSIEDLREATRAFFTGLDLIKRAQDGDNSIYATHNDHIQINMGVAWCLLYEDEILGETQGRAAEAFKKVIARYPESDQALVGLASAQIQSGQLDAAEKSLRAAIAKNERNVEAHKNLGIVLMSRGNLDAARKELERALELRPDHLEDQVWLARINMQQGREDDARAWIARARAAHPESSAPLFLEATLAAQHQQFDQSMQLVDQALERNPDDGEALALKGKLHAARGQTNSAKQALGRACELLPTNFEVNYNLGALLKDSSLDEALPYLARAYELRPPGPTGEPLRKFLLQVRYRAAHIPIGLAKADLARGDLAGASEWVAKAQAVEPGSGEVHLLAGDLAQRAGASADAERELLEARRLLPASLDARFDLAQLYLAANRNAEARTMLEELLGVVQREGAGAIADELLRRQAREQLEALRGK
jgi:protein O-mannosyl-transferase